MSYYDRLVKYYGVTEDATAGGFLLPDGLFLDFSEGSGQRSLDHRNITWVSNVPEKPREARYDVMVRIMRRVGMYRWSPEGWLLHAETLPTSAQLDAVEQLASIRPISIEAIDGKRGFWREYQTWESTDAWKDLLAFYRGR